MIDTVKPCSWDQLFCARLNQQGFPIFLLFKDRFLILYRIPFYLGF